MVCCCLSSVQSKRLNLRAVIYLIKWVTLATTRHVLLSVAMKVRISGYLVSKVDNMPTLSITCDVAVKSHKELSLRWLDNAMLAFFEPVVPS
jgi:hypothetical protein